MDNHKTILNKQLCHQKKSILTQNKAGAFHHQIFNQKYHYRRKKCV